MHLLSCEYQDKHRLKRSVIALILMTAFLTPSSFNAKAADLNARQKAADAISDEVPMPDKALAYSLIFEIIIAVNNANLTENYSVLRGLGAPDFQKKYDEEELDQLFAPLRQQKINLRQVVLVKPIITKSQYQPVKKLFRLKGHLPTTPVAAHFEIQFQYFQNRWRLYALNLNFKGNRNFKGVHLILPTL